MLTRVEFLYPNQAQRVPPQQPEHLRSHQKIDTHGSNDRACHRGCNSLFDEGNQVVGDRPVHNNSTCQRASTARAAFAKTLATAARGT